MILLKLLLKKDGAKVVYDIKNNDISFNIDGDKIEKNSIGIDYEFNIFRA